ncbi:beta-lactamase/transpeptidase-like protein [Nemania abortiva]|nr:beta-lactamase/transpeptidase-like protein [Nemania abortiva]
MWNPEGDTRSLLAILRISGTPSLSYAVIHDGHVITTQHFGFRDVEAQARPDNDTRHNINSLTKALVSSLVAMEVARDYLPGFASSDPFLQQECTIQDLVSHRTGLGAHDMACDALPTDSFIYNNLCYELPLSQLLHERIFKWKSPGGNNAKSYTVLDDLSAFEIPPPTMEKGQIMEAARGVKSSLSDLIRLYQEMLKAFPSSPSPNCLEIFGARNTLPGWSLREQSYGAGWCRAQLPALGAQPVVGEGRPSRLTAVNLLPETQSAVIALQNSLGPVDSADFVAELLVERLLGVQSPVDYAFKYMDMLKLKLDSDRKLGTMPKPLGADGHLAVVFQGLQSEPFNLRHYNYDTFSWWMPYNDVMRSGQYAIGTTSSFWLMRFEANNFGQMVKLSWAMDTAFPEWEEAFTRNSKLL